MDNKNIPIIAAVIVIVAIVAIGAVVIMNNNKSDNGGSSGDDTRTYDVNTSLRVFGNADNNNYLNKADLTFIKNIIDGKEKWDSATNPLADVNNDGKITNTDYDMVKDYLDGKKGTMYYVDWDNKRSSVPFPLTDALTDGKIHVGFSTGLDWFIILGLYDKVAWMGHGDIGPSTLDTELYPNITSVKEVTGSVTNDMYENMVKDKIKITMTDKRFYETAFLNTVANNYDNYALNVIKLPMNRSYGDATWIDSLVTLGAMCNLQDKTKAYIEYVEKVEKKIEDAIIAADVGSKTYIMPYYAPDYGLNPLYVDAHGTGDVLLADVYTVEMLPLFNGVSVYTADGFDAVDIESIKKYNPNVLIISSFGYATSKTTSTEQYFEDVTALAEEFRNIGYEGQIVSIAFENCTMAGPSFILSLASILWPDAFDEDEAWDIMYEYYHNFTNYKGTMDDLKASKFAVWEYIDL